MTFVFSKDPIVRYAQQQTRIEHQSFYIIFTGQGGGGKSYSCLEFLRQCDPTFDISRIAWSEKDFVQLLKKKMPPGSAIMWDEIGVGMDSRNFMNLIQKLMTYITMTMRYRRQIIGLTVPDILWIDIKTRKMLHAYVELLKDFQNNVAYGKFFILQTNYRYGKTYFKAPHKLINGMPYIVGRVGFPLPPASMLEEYERHKDQFGDELLENTERMIDSFQEQRGSKDQTYGTMVDYIRQNKKEFNDSKNKLSMGKVALKFNLQPYKLKPLREILKAEGLIRDKKIKEVQI